MAKLKEGAINMTAFYKERITNKMLVVFGLTLLNYIFLYLIYKGYTSITSDNFILKMPYVLWGIIIGFFVLAVYLFILSKVAKKHKHRYIYYYIFSLGFSLCCFFIGSNPEIADALRRMLGIIGLSSLAGHIHSNTVTAIKVITVVNSLYLAISITYYTYKYFNYDSSKEDEIRFKNG